MQKKKGQILDLLRGQNRKSGNELAKKLNISRNAVWKHIQELRKRGYKISSAPNAGYKLEKTPDCLFPEEIQFELKTRFIGKEIYYEQETESTQGVAHNLAQHDCREGTLAVCERQCKGKGRLQRPWTSLPGSIAFSLVLKPEIRPEQSTHLPILAGVAVAKALKKDFGFAPQLKWPNDVLIQGKKVCGILAEISADPDRINYLILGLGLNVNTQEKELPKELQNLATSLRISAQTSFSRTLVLKGILQELENEYLSYCQDGFSPVKQDWVIFNCTLNQKISLTQGNRVIQGLALDLDHSGALVLKDHQGKVHVLNSGDVTLLKN